MKFVDEVKIVIASGHGGAGRVSFRREAMTPRGGPDGGDGGKGGDLIVKASNQLNSLVDYKTGRKYNARDGEPGGSANMFGQKGDDYYLIVPKGTIIKNSENQILIDMTDMDEYVLLKGGRGGKGNTFFKNSINQAPEHAQPGEEGVELEVTLELKLIADVGIVGFPNAGKSTLISRISAARPRIADYPFTTLTPNLGVVKIADYKSFVVADIPGLVQGAHQGVGLGIQFLRHIERTRVFVHLVDISGASGRDPIQDYHDINFELKEYDKNNVNKEGFVPLSSREQIVVLNKTDVLSSDQIAVFVKKFEKILNYKPMVISAVAGKGIKELVFKMSQFVFGEEESV